MANQPAAVSFAALLEQRKRKLDAEKQRAVDAPADAPPRESPEETSYHVIERGGQTTDIWAMQGGSMMLIKPDSPEGQQLLREQKVKLHKPSAAEATRVENTPNDAATLLAGAEELAAVSGRFDPQEVLPAQASEEARRAVLNSLAPLCVVETHEDSVRWLLKKEHRGCVLTRLKDENRLAETLKGALPSTDRFGMMLRDLLRGGARVNLEGLGSEDVMALTSAVEATAEVGLPHPDVADLRRLASADFLADYDVLLMRGFYGRRDEIHQLSQFLSRPVASKSYSQSWDGTVLTGLGGAGKSTLLAKFARDLVKHRKATIVVLDFDRPGIDAHDTYWLEQEICRQVGRQYPEIDAVLHQRRRQEHRQREEYEVTVSQAAAESLEYGRSSRGIIWSVSDALMSIDASARPFLLILDTFEEVSEQGAGRLLDWLQDLLSALEPTPLKVVFSGRLFDADRELLRRHGVTESIEVNELEPLHAERLLVSNGVPQAAAQRLARSNVIPRRPLELTLLAKLTTDLDKTVDELEDELRRGGAAASELFAGLVYRRVLRRLDDPTARYLAYPGLVLRYVTPELIREVLAPALELPPFEGQTAEQALGVLASCHWLAYRDPADENKVWHRKELRRSTLKAMIAREPEKSRRINQVAVEYFSQLGDERAAAEAVYHRLMLTLEPNDGESFELAELQKANEYIGGDAADLPGTAATLLRFAVTGKVAPREVESLPSRYFQTAYDTAGRSLVNSRELGRAMRLLRRRREMSADYRPSPVSADSWETEAAFATASWAELRPQAPPPLRNITLKVVSNLLYPLALVSPVDVSMDYLTTMLNNVTLSRLKLLELYRGVEGETTLHRLIVSLISLRRFIERESVTGHAVETVVRQFRKLETEALPPVLQRRLMFLERSIVKEAGEPFRPNVTVHTIKLEPEWVNYFPWHFNDPARGGASDKNILRLFKDVEEALQSRLRGGRTVRNLLAAVDGLSKSRGGSRNLFLSISPDTTDAETFLRHFRGPDPEFRDPCRYALLEAFPDRPSRRRLGALIASVINLKLDDLKPDAFADALAADPEHALESYVEMVDRAWALGELMRRALKEGVTSAKLDMVSSAYERWDKAVRVTVQQAFQVS